MRRYHCVVTVQFDSENTPPFAMLHSLGRVLESLITHSRRCNGRWQVGWRLGECMNFVRYYSHFAYKWHHGKCRILSSALCNTLNTLTHCNFTTLPKCLILLKTRSLQQHPNIPFLGPLFSKFAAPLLSISRDLQVTDHTPVDCFLFRRPLLFSSSSIYPVDNVPR